jgi:hypothetical protein
MKARLVRRKPSNHIMQVHRVAAPASQLDYCSRYRTPAERAWSNSKSYLPRHGSGISRRSPNVHWARRWLRRKTRQDSHAEEHGNESHRTEASTGQH